VFPSRLLLPVTRFVVCCIIRVLSFPTGATTMGRSGACEVGEFNMRPIYVVVSIKEQEEQKVDCIRKHDGYIYVRLYAHNKLYTGKPV
jgi:hypothetical protein